MYMHVRTHPALTFGPCENTHPHGTRARVAGVVGGQGPHRNAAYATMRPMHQNCAAHARAWAIVKGAGISPACALLPAAEHPANGREGAAARPPRRRALPWCKSFNPLHPCLRVRVWERGACVWGGCRHAGAIAVTHMLNANVRCTRSVWCTPKVWCTPNVWSTLIITSGTCYFYLSCLVAVAVCVCVQGLGVRG